MNIKGRQGGFTIVELMIATSIFSMVLLAAAAGLIYVGRLYYKGIISARTQDTTRTVVDDIARPIQFAGGEVVPGNPAGPGNVNRAFCVDDTRYTYVLNQQVRRGGPHALWADERADDTCNAIADMNVAQPSPSGRELLGQSMRLKNFNISQVESGLWKIEVSVIYGDNDLINFTDPVNLTGPINCKQVSGSQWCAFSDLSTTVRSRL